ncbi:MAG: hypothetical protein K6G67_01000 [Lachnospiraceae bacterium]|nr:hypothetical protein [Lachnospiraceae bacterium]
MKKFLAKNYAYIVLIICFLVLLWRAFYGFCWTDESFYASTADRFYRGDLPLVGEWFRTQMSSILMIPLYAFYMMITGSNAGVILYFRILYLIFSFIVSIVAYRVIRKDYPGPVALMCSVFTMSYAHLGVATFSYYMMSHMFLLLALFLIYDHKNTGSWVRLVVAGVMTALAVMSMPALAIGYVAVMIAVLAVGIVGKIPKVPEAVREKIASIKLGRISLFTMIGIAIPAVIFMIYLLLHTNIRYLTETLPYVLVDNEHNNTWGYYIRKPHRSMTEVFGIYTWAVYFLCAITFVFQKPLQKRPFREAVVALDTILFAILAYLSYGHTGYISVAFFVFFIPLFFISRRKNHMLFVLFVIPSALFALIYCFASSDFLYIIALGLAMATSAGICAVYDLVSDNEDSDGGRPKSKVTDKVCAVPVICVCLYVLAITFTLRIVNVYRDAPLDKLTARIGDGVAKGLYTTGEHLTQYNDVCEVINDYCMGTDDFETISGNPKGNVLFSKILPWGYMVSELSCGYPTTWRSTAYDADRLDLYYDINKTSRPDVIIVLDTAYGSYDAAGDVEDDHEPNLDEMSDYWKDYISDNGFEEIRAKCGRVYRRPKQ